MECTASRNQRMNFNYCWLRIVVGGRKQSDPRVDTTWRQTTTVSRLCIFFSWRSRKTSRECISAVTAISPHHCSLCYVDHQNNTQDTHRTPYLIPFQVTSGYTPKRSDLPGQWKMLMLPSGTLESSKKTSFWDCTTSTFNSLAMTPSLSVNVPVSAFWILGRSTAL